MKNETDSRYRANKDQQLLALLKSEYPDQVSIYYHGVIIVAPTFARLKAILKGIGIEYTEVLHLIPTRGGRDRSDRRI